MLFVNENGTLPYFGAKEKEKETLVVCVVTIIELSFLSLLFLFEKSKARVSFTQHNKLA